MVIVEKVKIGEDVFDVSMEKVHSGSWYDEIRVKEPSDAFPYWIIDFYKQGDYVKNVTVTGNVAVMRKITDEKEVIDR